MQPYWNRLVEECKNKIMEKFPEYGNSWVEQLFLNPEFWLKRLEGEVEELKPYLQIHDGNRDVIMKECVDIINICAMIYSIHAKVEWEWKMDGRHG